MITAEENRERWLESAITSLRTFFTDGPKPSEVIKVSCGFPSKSPLTKNPRIGECWQPKSSADKKTTHIFISPVINEDIKVLDVLLHELIHACGIDGHRANFKAVATKLGLEGPATATYAGEALRLRLNDVLKVLGPYPSPSLIPGNKEKKKQTTRMLKAVCGTCGYTIRLSQKWAEQGMPVCYDGTKFIISNEGEEHETEES